MEDPANSFDLSPEQRDNATLLRDLLGPAMAARYEDFCRLSAGAFALNVSKPVAAHALREMESMLRDILEVPMDALPEEHPSFEEKSRAVGKLLVELGSTNRQFNGSWRTSNRGLPTRHKCSKS